LREATVVVEKEAKKAAKSSLDKGFHYITVTESPQAGCLLYTTLSVKTAADHITNLDGLYRRNTTSIENTTPSYSKTTKKQLQNDCGLEVQDKNMLE
jgi:hypothetical protein